MIIRELYLKNFGKFSETKIELEEGFHIFTEKMSSEKVHCMLLSEVCYLD